MRRVNAEGPPKAALLLIDDNCNGLCVRKAVLEERGYEVTTAETPAEGLRLFAEKRFDLVITDYNMPEMNGIEVIARLRLERPDLPVILLSGLVEQLGLDEDSSGADAVIAKSSNEAAHLLRTVSRLLKPKAPKKPVAKQQALGPRRQKLKNE